MLNLKIPVHFNLDVKHDDLFIEIIDLCDSIVQGKTVINDANGIPMSAELAMSAVSLQNVCDFITNRFLMRANGFCIMHVNPTPQIKVIAEAVMAKISLEVNQTTIDNTVLTETSE